MDMSKDQLKAFFAKAQSDASLQSKLKQGISAEQIVAVAKESGFTIDAEDLLEAQSELSEEGLGGLSGGVTIGLGVCNM